MIMKPLSDGNPSRPLLAFVLSIAVLSSTIPFTACNSQTALQDVEKFEPVVINALTLACTIQSTLPICGAMQTTITNDYQLVIHLWQDWNAAVKAGTSTSALWNDLNAAFQTFEQDSALIFAAATGLNAPELTAIVVAAQVLLAAIEILFPGDPSGAVQPKRLFAKYGINHPAAYYDRTWFKGWAKDYDEKVDIAQRMHPRVQLHKVHASFFPF